MSTDRKAKNSRESGIELLKIIAIILIVLSHVVQTLSTESTIVPSQDYVIDLDHATTDISQLTLTVLRYSGVLGNTIFFVSSAWFLAGRKKKARDKALQLLLDVWVISVVICGIVLILRGGDLPVKTILTQFIPTTNANNWYMTCYIIFLFAYPVLNTVIDNLNQRQLLRVIFIMSFFWIIMDFISGRLFSPSTFLLWSAVYFIVAYTKKYIPQLQSGKKAAAWITVIGFLGLIGLTVLTNILGLRFSFLSDKLLKWNANCNPFCIMIAIGLFYLFRQVKFKSGFVNYISSLSMPIYLIHENILLREYYRPLVWQWIHGNLGYSHILLWTFIFTIALFTAAAIASVIYKEALQKTVAAISNKIYAALSKLWIKIENKTVK